MNIIETDRPTSVARALASLFPEHEPATPDRPRRSFLAGLAALGAGALLPGCQSTSAPSGAGKLHRVDIHHHILPPKYLADTVKQRGPGNVPKWSPALSIEDMDRNGIATSVTALMQPHVDFGDVPLGRRLAREANEYAAKMRQDYPGRFGIFATLPYTDVEGSLREIEHSYGALAADGIGLMTSYGTRYLGDPAFWPILEELNRRKAVVYTHPLSPACCRNPFPGSMVPPSAIEYATDTTRTMASLLFTGAAARFPDIRWIFSHSGGTLPFLYSRFTRQESEMKDREKVFPNGLRHEVRKFYYDTAQGHHDGALAALLKLVPVSNVMFGTDYPYRPGSETVGGLTAWGFSAADMDAIDRGNALRLMPRLRG